MQTTTSSLPEFRSIAYTDHKVQRSKGLHCKGWRCSAKFSGSEVRRLWRFWHWYCQSFQIFSITGVPLPFLQPADDENLYLNSGPNLIVYNAAIGACEKGPIPAFFDGPNPRAQAAAAWTVSSVTFLACCQAFGGRWTLAYSSLFCDYSRFSQIYRVFFLGNLSCMKSAAGTFWWAEPKKSRASRSSVMTCHVDFVTFAWERIDQIHL